MARKFSALVFEEHGWQIAQCIELDLASQGNTAEEAFHNLQEAMQLHLQNPTSTILTPFAESTKEALTFHPTAAVLHWEY